MAGVTTKARSFRAKLSRVLTQAFPGAAVQLDQSKPLGKFSGLVVWDGFGGLEQVDRQARLWKRLRAELSKEEQLKITAILTMTPAER